MRVLQINKFHWLKGGAERYYFDLQAELAARGHEVAVFAASNLENAPSPWERYFAPDAAYHRAGPVEAVRLARDVIYNREAGRRLERLLADFRPDVAHLHNFHHQLSPAILDVLEQARVPVAQTLHDYKWVCPAYLFLSHGEVCEACGPGNRFSPVWRRRCHHESLVRSLVVYLESRRSWQRGDSSKVARFLAPSRFMKERVVAHGLPADRVVEMPYFLRLAGYDPAASSGSSFLYVGRLSKEKGLETLFEAMGRLSGVRLHVAGVGPLEARLKERAAQRNLPVKFLGYLDAPALHQAVREARAVVVPSEWYENQPYAVLEAFALGVPVVGSAIGGIPELVIDGHTGLLVPPRNPEALASALSRLAADGAAARSMGQAARRRIESDFDAAAAVDRLESLYAELARAAMRSASVSMPG